MQDLGIVSPTLDEFRTLAATTRVIPVRVKILADGMTPIGIYRNLVLDAQGKAAPGTFLLESAKVAEGGKAAWDRYSFIGVNTRSTLTTVDGKVHWQGITPAGAPVDGDPAQAIADTLSMLHTDYREHAADLPPLTSGLVGYMGWDVVRRWEHLPFPPADDVNLPEFALNMVSDMAIHDNLDGTLLLVANAINFNGTDENVDAAYEDALARLEAMLTRFEAPAAGAASTLSGVEAVSERVRREVVQTWSEQGFMDAIERSKKNIIDGDVFQIVLSRRFEVETNANALDVYRVLRQTNPSPYMYLFNFEDANGAPFQIVGSSPEALVTLKDGRATTHPIAGSRPRGATESADVALAEELLADQKERSEHLMLVDLARNDLSRIAKPGTVSVDKFMIIERFSHIMHISSSVSADLDPAYSAYDVLRVAFPAGTLSGAPKPRAMQLIDEYEPTRRGVYGGVCGYFDFAGNMDMAIAIRTAVLKSGKAYVQAGAGIVMDSVPTSETEETVNKSAAPLRAVLTADGLADVSSSIVKGA
ncbi:MAG: anthranilate synthase component I [Rothia sp. (in: high G+C Gram-positive bacteria)]|uniref:anthranilate synthase component I n=1 Tax=Rothia sp. (in: high G+C Gram-positive bacteria) TaxID=1885016 RepID=UPI0026E0A190|nr:anthranilate synthase component I [Rothia sp. (in: high G+C Gram-positive bacteria)]MDO5750866.1 anthranilate synthase component I [Rothia sp. (in: high G+C Gram-positive bacteria)]